MRFANVFNTYLWAGSAVWWQNFVDQNARGMVPIDYSKVLALSGAGEKGSGWESRTVAPL